MKQKLFTLLTLLVLCVTGAWGDVTWPDANYLVIGPSSTTSSQGGLTFTKSSTYAIQSFSGTGTSKFNGVNFTYGLKHESATSTTFTTTGKATITIVQTTVLNSDKKINMDGKELSTWTGATKTTYTGEDNTETYANIFIYTIPDVNAGEHTIVRNGGQPYMLYVGVTYSGASAPEFSPATGSSVAEGSKIEITSANSTSIKYKWTNSDATPDGGWSTYDAEDKVTVPAASDGTPYLHAQGFKGETPGTAGYAQYTITDPDTDAPTLSSTSPVNSATDVAISGNIVLTFDENVVCTTNATLTPEGGDPINLTPVVDGATVTYAYAGIAYKKAHTFNLAANSVADGSGNQYASAINFSFTTTQETCATPTFTVYGNKVVKITCATAGATIYYGGSDVKTGEKTEYTGLFVPASNGTIYAYATKTGANDSELGSQAITLPVAGDVVGNKLMLLQPATTPAGSFSYGDEGFVKGGFSIKGASIQNSNMSKYPNNFKVNNNADITVTPPSDVTIQSIKIYGANNNSETATTNVTVGSSFSIVNNAALMPKNVFVNDAQVMSEVVITPNSATEGATVVFRVGAQSRIYVEVYGTTSAENEAITPAKTYTTYIPNHDLDFTGHAKLTAYIATAANASSVTMTSVNKVPAGTPVVLKATETGAAINVPIAASTDDVSANKLVIGDGKTEIGGDGKYDYILKDGLFCKVTTASELAAGKCYLHLEAAPAAKELTIDFEDGDVTAIKAVEAKKVENGVFYNLAGQQVAQPTKGLYIVNGRKVVIK